MKIIVTEQQYKKLVNEVNRSEYYSDDNPVYNYKSIAVRPADKYDPKKFIAFFNGVEFGKSDYRKPNEPEYVTFNGPNGEFEFHKEDVKSKGSSPFIFSDKLYYDDTETYDRLYKLLDTSKINIKQEIKPYQIRKSLELAFPPTNDIKDGKWNYEDEIFSAGVRGVYTIGEYLGTDDSWSILNFFDTKTEIQDKINEKYSKSDSDLDIVEWFSNELTNNPEFIEPLVERQWESIQNGYKSEELAKDMVNGNEVIFYPSGSIMDRYKGVDVTIDGINYQIKPLVSYAGKKGGPYFIKTYGMRDYKDKNLVDKILFVNPNKMLEFDNDNYTHSFTSAVFTELPTKIYDVD